MKKRCTTLSPLLTIAGPFAQNNTPTDIFILFIRQGCLLGYLGLFLLFTPARAQVIPRSADSFVESIGVNTHWTYNDRVYAKFPELKERLAELGIRHIRDGAISAVNDSARHRINRLYTDLNIRATLVTGRRAEIPGSERPWRNPLDVSQVGQELQAVREAYPAALIAALEGPNEYDHFRDTTLEGSTTWPTTLRQYQQALYEQANNPFFDDITIIGPTLITAPAYRQVKSLDGSLDHSGVHAYQGTYPGNTLFGFSVDYFLYQQAAVQSPLGKPVQSTECGYHNDLTRGGVSEKAQGKYTSRMLAEFFRRGIFRSFVYELIDQGTDKEKENTFGLLRNDLTPKPAFLAIKSLIHLLADPGESFEPTSLTYQLSGDTTNVRQVLLQKRDGTYYLLLWLEVPSWDTQRKVDLFPASQATYLQLPDQFPKSTLHRLTAEGLPESSALTLTNGGVHLAITDRMQVIELRQADNPDSVAETAPVADATVRGGSYGNQNYGTTAYLLVKDAHANLRRRSFLRFDASSLKSGARTELVLTVTSLGGENIADRPVALYALLDSSWQEEQVTWNNQPGIGEHLTTFTVGAEDLGQPLTVDVTDFVARQRAKDGKVNLALVQPPGKNALVSFGARESATPPLLRSLIGEQTDEQWPSGRRAAQSLRTTETTRALILYPNPSSEGKLGLQLVGFAPALVQIIDLKGQVVYRATHQEAHIQLDRRFPRGLYVVQVSDAQSTLTEQLLVE